MSNFIRPICLDPQKLQDYTFKKGPGITRSIKRALEFPEPLCFSALAI